MSLPQPIRLSCSSRFVVVVVCCQKLSSPSDCCLEIIAQLTFIKLCLGLLGFQSHCAALAHTSYCAVSDALEQGSGYLTREIERVGTERVTLQHDDWTRESIGCGPSLISGEMAAASASSFW